MNEWKTNIPVVGRGQGQWGGASSADTTDKIIIRNPNPDQVGVRIKVFVQCLGPSKDQSYNFNINLKSIKKE